MYVLVPRPLTHGQPIVTQGRQASRLVRSHCTYTAHAFMCVRALTSALLACMAGLNGARLIMTSECHCQLEGSTSDAAFDPTLSLHTLDLSDHFLRFLGLARLCKRRLGSIGTYVAFSSSSHASCELRSVEAGMPFAVSRETKTWLPGSLGFHRFYFPVFCTVRLGAQSREDQSAIWGSGE